MIISVPVQTAACPARADGALTSDVAPVQACGWEIPDTEIARRVLPAVPWLPEAGFTVSHGRFDAAVQSSVLKGSPAFVNVTV